MTEEEKKNSETEEMEPVETEENEHFTVHSHQDEPTYSLFYKKYLKYFRKDLYLWLICSLLSIVFCVVYTQMNHKFNAALLLLPVVLIYNTITVTPQYFIMKQKKYNMKVVKQSTIDVDFTFFDHFMKVYNKTANVELKCPYSDGKKVVFSEEMIALQFASRNVFFFRTDSVEPAGKNALRDFLKEKNKDLIVIEK